MCTMYPASQIKPNNIKSSPVISYTISLLLLFSPLHSECYYSLSERWRRSSSSDMWSLEDEFSSPHFFGGLFKSGMVWLMSELSDWLSRILLTLTNGITSLMSLSWVVTDPLIGSFWRLPFAILLPEEFTSVHVSWELLAVTKLWKVGWLWGLFMGMVPWLHILGGDCKMEGDACEGLDTVWETRRRAGDFGMAGKKKKIAVSLS